MLEPKAPRMCDGAQGARAHTYRRRLSAQVLAAVVVTLLLLQGRSTALSASVHPPTAMVRVVHASPDAGAVDVTLDGRPLAENFTHASETAQTAVPAGVVRLLVSRHGAPAELLLERSIDLTAGGAAIVVLAGLAAGEPALTALVLADDTGGVGSGRFMLRFLNLSPGSGPATLATDDGAILLESIGFGGIGEAILEPGRFTLRAVLPGRAGDSTAEAALVGEATRTYTLLLIGQSGGPHRPTLVLLAHRRTSAAGPPSGMMGPGSVLVNETFRDPATGLLPAAAPAGATLLYGYVDGEYFLRNLEVATQSLPIPGDHANATIAVDVRLIGETRSRTVSVGCRFSSDASGNRGYRLRVEPAAGLFRLVREDGQRDTFLRTDRISAAIRRGAETNRLELTCAASTITAAINGVEVASVQDSTYTAGPLVIGVGARSSGLTSEARFDNLVVTQR